MTKRNLLAPVALLVLLVALLASPGGMADAVGHKIGKNLVVTKSIKNGAVTGQKVKDGSLTRADLAPGTIPAPSPGRSILTASRTSTPSAPGASVLWSPSGPSTTGETPYSLAPVDLTLSDLRVRLSESQPAGKSLRVALVSGVEGGATVLTSCVVPPLGDACSAPTAVTVRAGELFYLVATADALNGSNGGAILSALVLTVS